MAAECSKDQAKLRSKKKHHVSSDSKNDRGDDDEPDDLHATSADEVHFTDTVSSSRMVSSLLKDHDRNLEVARIFNSSDKSVSMDSACEPSVSILDSIHIDPQYHSIDPSRFPLNDSKSKSKHWKFVRSTTRTHATEDTKEQIRSMPSIAVKMESIEAGSNSYNAGLQSTATADMDKLGDAFYRQSSLGKLFRNRGKSVQRAKEQMIKGSPEAMDSGSIYCTPRKSLTKQGPDEMQETVILEGPVRAGTTGFSDEHRMEYRRGASKKMERGNSLATPGDTSKTGMDNILSKIKRVLEFDMSHEIHPPVIHSFKNKMFALRTPWQLPMKERSLRNNTQQVLSFFRVLERYVEDQVFRYGPSSHPKLDKVYNEVYTNVDQLFKRVSNKYITQLADRRRLAVVGNGLYDLGSHLPRGSPVYYQKFMVFDLSQDGSNFAAEHADLFHNQVLSFPMNIRGLPSMRYLCTVSSAVLFWLDFYNRDNLVVFNYSSLNYNMLLTFACAVLSSQPSSTANEIDQIIANSFEWRKRCQAVSKGNKSKQEIKYNSDMPPMIPIARWPPSYKRYMSYFLSLYGTPVDFMFAQQFKLKTITLVNCLIPGTEVTLEIYKIGHTYNVSQSKSVTQNPGEECSRYTALFYPKCVCGGKERDGAMLVACPSDYTITTTSTPAKAGKYGYVGEVTFDFTTDAAGNKREIVISGDIAISIATLYRRQKKVVATYSFNTGFVNSEILEIPKAELDIWDTSSAIQPQGQVTIAMELMQGNSTKNNDLMMTPPASDVGIFTRHHIVKVEETEVDSLMAETGLSKDTCKFARKLCKNYADTVAILTTLFKQQAEQAEMENMVHRENKEIGPQMPMVKSIDVPKPLVDTSGIAEGSSSNQVGSSRISDDDSIGTGRSYGDKDPSTSVKTSLNLEQVERLSMEPDGSMNVLLVDGTKVPVPNNTIGSLFKMFETHQKAENGLVKATGLQDGASNIKDQMVEGDIQPENVKSLPENQVNTQPKAAASLSKAVPTMEKISISKKVPPASMPKSISKEVPPDMKAKGKSPVTKSSALCVKKGPPCKIKAPAPPPPLPLKAKATSKKAPPPLGVKLHWRPLNMNTVKGTIFESLPKPNSGNKMFDSSLVKQLFSKTTVKRQNTMKAEEVKKKMALGIFDSKRAQNVGIILRFPKESDLDDLIDCVDRLELDHPIVNMDNVSKIIIAYPQGAEMEAFKEAITSGVDLCNYRDIERKVFKILNREQMENKAKVVSFALNYKNILSAINEQLSVFEDANSQITHSEFLPLAMGVILQYGNYVNHGDDAETETLGFSLSSATKLFDIKSTDNTLSSMHYLVVNMIVKFPDCDFTKFDKGFNHIIDAEKISASGLDEMFDEIRDGMNFLLRLQEKVDQESPLYSKVKELLKESTEAMGITSENHKNVLEAIRNTWRYLGEECKQGSPLEEIFKILGDFVRCIKRVISDIQQRPSKFLVALNAEEERELFRTKFMRSRRVLNN